MSRDFRDLEILVSRIQKQLAPHADVLHDVKLRGKKSGTNRQVDVLVQQRVGQYDIKIVIECKDSVRPIDVKGVEEFYGLLDDIGAQKGVIVCPSGFTKTAKTRAEHLQIDLCSPIDTDPHKWRAKATIPAVCEFRHAGFQFSLSMAEPVPFELDTHFPHNKIIYDLEKRRIGTPFEACLEPIREEVESFESAVIRCVSRRFAEAAGWRGRWSIGVRRIGGGCATRPI